MKEMNNEVGEDELGWLFICYDDVISANLILVITVYLCHSFIPNDKFVGGES